MSPRGDLPLGGVRVVVTRAAHQADATAAAFEAAGARVERLPLLEVVAPDDPGPLDRALAALRPSAAFDWIVFTSTNAVEQVLARLPASAGTPLPAGLRVAAIGPSTSQALRAHGIRPDLEAADSRAEGLAEQLVPRLSAGERVLLPQAADARPVLEELLVAAGAEVTRVDAYAKRMPPASRRRAEEIFDAPSRDEPLGWVTFTSPSIARNFARLGEEVWGPAWAARRRGLLAVSIGSVTGAALRKLGIEPVAEAATPGDREMVEAVIAARAARDRR